MYHYDECVVKLSLVVCFGGAPAGRHNRGGHRNNNQRGKKWVKKGVTWRPPLMGGKTINSWAGHAEEQEAYQEELNGVPVSYSKRKCFFSSICIYMPMMISRYLELPFHDSDP